MYGKRLHKSWLFKLMQIVLFCALFVVQMQARFIRMASRDFSRQVQSVASTKKSADAAVQSKSSTVKKFKFNKRYQNTPLFVMPPNGTIVQRFDVFTQRTKVYFASHLSVEERDAYLLRGPPTVA